VNVAASDTDALQGKTPPAHVERQWLIQRSNLWKLPSLSCQHSNGDFNTAVGIAALSLNTTGSNNVALGRLAGTGVTTASDVICIGALVSGANISNSCYIGNIYSNIQPIVGTDPDSVIINSSGRLGRGNVSSRRYKHDIQSMHSASEVLYALRPVSFRYLKEYDASQTIAFGLIAEEVAEVNPDLVGRNPEGQPESVRYEQINAMLLNEFLKEHRKGEEQHGKIQEQEKTIAQLKAELGALAATVKRASVTIAESQRAAANQQRCRATDCRESINSRRHCSVACVKGRIVRSSPRRTPLQRAAQ
jgi:Chaperone of endosialidase